MAFETKYICEDCNHIFYKLTDTDPRKRKGGRLPSCPECRKSKAKEQLRIRINGNAAAKDIAPRASEAERVANFKEALKSGSVFSIGGTNQRNKAIDETAEIVMKDYNMTDLNMGSHLRAGDNCVPKLSHELESKVDEVFNSKPKNNVMGMAGDNLTKALTKQINAGQFRNYGDPVARQQADPTLKPKTNVMYHHNEKPSVN